MSAELPLQIAGEQLLLLADKALYWPAQQMLCVADLHFGKAAAYRALGQPVPVGTTRNNLQRLDALLSAYAVKQLVFLGDFFHAPQSLNAATLLALADWRQRHAAIHCTLIRGNHDRRAGDPPAELDIMLKDEPLLVGPFALRHIPAIEPGRHVIAGHVHPVFSLQGKGRQKLRLPCFFHDPQTTLLPSFGDFTGGHAMTQSPGSQIVVCAEGALWPIAASG